MRLSSIQALRAVAAYAVVVHHQLDTLGNYLGIEAARHGPRVFMSGVDVFFVISGFVMAESTARASIHAPGRFLRARLVRIAPTYWLLTLLVFALQRQGVKLFGHAHPSVAELLTSLSFGLPFDGAPAREPLLFVGWSLEYELLFYLLLALAMWLRPSAGPLATVVAMVCGLSVLGMMSGNPHLAHWGKPIILEFAAGILVWKLWRQSKCSVPEATATLVAGSAALFATTLLDGPWHAHERALFFGVPATLIVFGAVSLEQCGVAPRNRTLLGQGDASYAVYLTHPFVLQAVGKGVLLLAGGLSAALRGGAFVLVVMLLVPLVGTAFYRFVERPLGRWLASGGALRRRTHTAARA
jgi:exopolysaccharide production protein ExoZ